MMDSAAFCNNVLLLMSFADGVEVSGTVSQPEIYAFYNQVIHETEPHERQRLALLYPDKITTFMNQPFVSPVEKAYLLASLVDWNISDDGLTAEPNMSSVRDILSKTAGFVRIQISDFLFVFLNQPLRMHFEALAKLLKPSSMITKDTAAMRLPIPMGGGRHPPTRNHHRGSSKSKSRRSKTFSRRYRSRRR